MSGQIRRSPDSAPGLARKTANEARARQKSLLPCDAAPLRTVDPPAHSSAAEAPELWLGVHLPTLALDALRGAGGPAISAAALAIVEPEGRVPHVVIADDAAGAAGVRPGMPLAAALALLPTLGVRPRDPRRERLLLERLAARALTFTPRVSPEPPDGLLLEVRGSLGLFGGARALGSALRRDCAALGVRTQLALAPTPLAALAGARAGAGFIVRHRAQLAGRLAPLPLGVLRWPDDTLARLAAMGVRTVGEVVRLPRAGFARRFGAAALASLDRLMGRVPEPRRAFVGRERFHARFEPAYELSDAAAILIVLEPLLADLERFLRARQCGIGTLSLRLLHRQAPPTVCTLRLVRAAFEAAHFRALLRERLAACELPEPAIRCELHSGALVPTHFRGESLWRAGEHGGEAGSESPAFIEQLRARLGAKAVYGLALVPEHRPENAWRSAEVEPAGLRAAAACDEPGAHPASRAAVASAVSSARPLWLLREPCRLEARHGRPWRGGALELLEGPERIETGWWDGRDVQRDYYVARDIRGAQLWIYRDRQSPRKWFLHGLFG